MDKTYILKPGVKIRIEENSQWAIGFTSDRTILHMSEDYKNLAFVEFSVDATRKQLRDALEPEICYWQDTSDDTTEYWGEELLDSVVEKALTVLGLLGGTTNE